MEQKHFPLDFIKWYSGMSETQISNAFKRWHKEGYSKCEHLHQKWYGNPPNAIRKCEVCGIQMNKPLVPVKDRSSQNR